MKSKFKLNTLYTIFYKYYNIFNDFRSWDGC